MAQTTYTLLAPQDPAPFIGESGVRGLTDLFAAILALSLPETISSLGPSQTPSSWDLNFTGPLAAPKVALVQAVIDAHDANNALSLSASSAPPGTIPACFMDGGVRQITQTEVQIDLGTTIFDRSGVWIPSTGSITVPLEGVYHISYSIPVNDDSNAGSPRSRVFAHVKRGGVQIAQSIGQDYAREASGGEGVSSSFDCELSAGDVLDLWIQASGTTDISTEPNQSQLSIHRVAL